MTENESFFLCSLIFTDELHNLRERPKVFMETHAEALLTLEKNQGTPPHRCVFLSAKAECVSSLSPPSAFVFGLGSQKALCR